MKTITVEFKFSDEEFEKLKKNANYVGMSVKDYLNKNVRQLLKAYEKIETK